MPPLLYILIFLAVFLAAEGIWMVMSDRRSGARATARRRLRQIALGIQNPDVQTEDSILRSRRESRRMLVDFAKFFPGGGQLERRLYQAGLAIT